MEWELHILLIGDLSLFVGWKKHQILLFFWEIFDILLRYSDEPNEKKERDKCRYLRKMRNTHKTIAILNIHLLFAWQKGSKW